ncbi:MAG: N-acetylglucosamine kinase [Robiginitomaculum sp.]|nr:MAG: N-acetylglucosamine kinase [Robiginitomaculum sp.]
MYFLGIDAGGTKCRARLTDGSGHVIGEGLSGSANANTGISNVFAAIQDAYQQSIVSAKLDAHDIASIRAGIGVAGIGRKDAKEELQAQPFPFHSTCIHNDAFIANIGAHSGQDGGIVIIGTGSIAIGRVKGKDVRAGGYGFPISDEGSGAYIGLQAIRITLRASDGRISHSELTQHLFQKFNCRTHEIVSWMDKATAPDYATLAPIVLQAAETGDRHGRLITRHSANHIDSMVRSLYDSGVPRCALLGGLAASIEPWLAPDIRAELVDPDGDALAGALLLARQQTTDQKNLGD